MDRKNEEYRRQTDNFSTPPVREHFRQIRICVHFISVLTFAGGLFSIARGFTEGGAVEISFGVFMGFVYTTLTVFLFRYARSIRDYLANETLANLDKAMERQSIFWMLSAFLAVLWTLVYFIFSS